MRRWLDEVSSVLRRTAPLELIEGLSAGRALSSAELGEAGLLDTARTSRKVLGRVGEVE